MTSALFALAETSPRYSKTGYLTWQVRAGQSKAAAVCRSESISMERKKKEEKVMSQPNRRSLSKPRGWKKYSRYISGTLFTCQQRDKLLKNSLFKAVVMLPCDVTDFYLKSSDTFKRFTQGTDSQGCTHPFWRHPFSQCSTITHVCKSRQLIPFQTVGSQLVGEEWSAMRSNAIRRRTDLPTLPLRFY